jgi:tRNA nucleotidyltransferase (CCA-adding enzyme)
MNYKQVHKKIFDEIIPSREFRKHINKITIEIKKKIEIEVSHRKISANVLLVGSVAKDTYIQNNLDIDFFICFAKNYSKKEIAKHTLSIGKTILKNTEESYAEHPYLRGDYNKFHVEIVPCYKIVNSRQKLSAVDRTPLHTKLIVDNLLEKQKPEVRLLKQFLIGIMCYGAEAQIEGFSGYLSELLIIKYGTFINLLKNVINWEIGKKITLFNVKYTDFDSPLTFIDPVDCNRNVASALSKEKFMLFIKASQEYLKSPRITFFFPNPIRPWTVDRIESVLKKRKCNYVGIRFQKPDIIDENLYPQIRKTIKSIKNESSRYGFSIFNSKYFIDHHNNEVFIILEFDKKLLNKIYVHTGPPCDRKKNSKDFLEKWKNNDKVIDAPYMINNRWHIKIKRDYIEFIEFIKNRINGLSMGKQINVIIKKKHNILESNELIIDNLREFWTEYLDGKMSWER